MANELRPKQFNFLVHLLNGCNIAEAARKANVSEVTARKWWKDPLFQEEFRQAQDAIMTSLRHKLTSATDRAVEALSTLLDSKDEVSILRSAKILLENYSKLVEIYSLDQKITQLEESR